MPRLAAVNVDNVSVQCWAWRFSASTRDKISPRLQRPQKGEHQRYLSSRCWHGPVLFLSGTFRSLASLVVSCPSCPCSASLSPRPSPFHPTTSYSAVLRPDGLPTRQRRRPRPCHRLRIRPDVKPREPLRRDSALPVAFPTSRASSTRCSIQHSNRPQAPDGRDWRLLLNRRVNCKQSTAGAACS